VSCIGRKPFIPAVLRPEAILEAKRLVRVMEGANTPFDQVRKSWPDPQRQ
jgi:hypothetical protein